MSQETATLRGTLSFLELLVKKASRGEFEEPILRARRTGGTPAVLNELEQAKDLALNVDQRLKDAHRRKDRLSALMDTARDLGEQEDLDALLTTVVKRARQLLHVDIAWVCLFEEDGAGSVCVSDGAVSPLTVAHPPSVPGLGTMATDGRPLIWTSDYLRDASLPRFEPIDAVVQEEELAALLAVALCRGDRVIGVLYAGDRVVRSFSAEEVALMNSLGEFVGIYTERIRALDEARARVAALTVELEQLRARQRAEFHAVATGWRLIDMLIGGGAQDLATEAAKALGGSVMLRSEADAFLARAGEPAWEVDEDELAKAAFTARAENRWVCLDGGLRVVPVRVADEDLGSLVVRSATPEAEPDPYIVEQTVRAAAVLAVLNRGRQATGRQARDAALGELIGAPSGVRGRQGLSAQYLDLDLSRPHVVVVARTGSPEQGRVATWASTYVSWNRGAKAQYERNLVLLLPGDSPREAASEVRRYLSRALDHPVAAAGALASGGRSGVLRAYHEAVRCLEALTALGRDNTAATVDDLGFVGMLLGESRDVEAFIRATLGPVVAYDAERSTDLISTLRAYFAAGGSPTYSAEALRVHPNTVARRLERISQLLGPDWQQPGPALEIQLALRLQQVSASLQARAGGA